jgi:hypothetical protein
MWLTDYITKVDAEKNAAIELIEAEARGAAAIALARTENEIRLIQAQLQAELELIRTKKLKLTNAKKCRNSFDVGSGNNTDEDYLDSYAYVDPM